ncbi:hypothetical protein HB884_11985 [Listeria booriae]|uniref:hypothetical protein n=1 Tax=Listeria booriae TaxID=1552123 RepID=UPI0016238C67|nr:hypothetical protein [Listeria booriae]MBC1524919.1 hypothetical protein [Listeria booriae]
MNKDGQNVIICKNCGSNKVNFTGSLSLILLFLGIFLVCIGIWIPIFGWFVMIPVGVISMISSLPAMLYKKKNFRCTSCKHSFKISNIEYKEYKQAIK